MESLKEIVYQRICDMIFANDIAPGRRLPGEFELSREMGVSRVTLRSALSRLEEEGMISRSRQHGTVVKPCAHPRPKVLVVVKFCGSELTDTPELQMISGVSARCLELGMEIETLSYEYFSGETFLGDRYTGVIQAGCAFLGGEKLLETLNRCGLPVVNAMAFESDPQVTGQTTVLTDAFRAWFDGLEHLLQFGHRRIAFLLNDREIVERRFNRTFEEFRTAVGRHCPNDKRLFLFPESDGHFSDKVSALLDSSGPPTAFYCYKDAYALEIYRLARTRGLNIPKDIAVMGFSGGAGAPLLRPSLSTVDFGYQRVGRIAADVLADHLRWNAMVRKPIIHAPYSVIGRESTDFFIVDYAGETRHAVPTLQEA